MFFDDRAPRVYISYGLVFARLLLIGGGTRSKLEFCDSANPLPESNMSLSSGFNLRLAENSTAVTFADDVLDPLAEE